MLINGLSSGPSPACGLSGLKLYVYCSMPSSLSLLSTVHHSSSGISVSHGVGLLFLQTSKSYHFPQSLPKVLNHALWKHAPMITVLYYVLILFIQHPQAPASDTALPSCCSHVVSSCSCFLRVPKLPQQA